MTNESANSQETEKSADKSSVTIYFQEALRISELQLEKQKETFETTERKAILLITVCLATIAFLLSWDAGNREVCNVNLAIAISVVIILAMAAIIGAFALFTRPFGIPGANPEYLMHKDFERDFHKVAKNLLGYYEERYKLNEDVNRDKTNYLNISKWIGMLGIILALGWIIVKLGCGCCIQHKYDILTQVSWAFLPF